VAQGYLFYVEEVTEAVRGMLTPGGQLKIKAYDEYMRRL
jgi:hypothetical protein